MEPWFDGLNPDDLLAFLQGQGLLDGGLLDVASDATLAQPMSAPSSAPPPDVMANVVPQVMPTVASWAPEESQTLPDLRGLLGLPEINVPDQGATQPPELMVKLAAETPTVTPARWQEQWVAPEVVPDMVQALPQIQAPQPAPSYPVPSAGLLDFAPAMNLGNWQPAVQAPVTPESVSPVAANQLPSWPSEPTPAAALAEPVNTASLLDLLPKVAAIDPPVTRSVASMPTPVEPTPPPAPAAVASPAPVAAPVAPFRVGQQAFSSLDIARDAALRPELWRQLGWTGGATFSPGSGGGGEDRQDTPDAINPEFEKFLADNGLSSGYDLNGENVTRYLAKNGQVIDTQQGTTGVDHGALMTYGPMLLALAASGAAAPYLSAAAGGGALGGAAAGAFSGAAGAIGAGQQDLGQILRGAGVGSLGGALLGNLNAAPDLADIPVAPRTAVGNLEGLLDAAPTLTDNTELVRQAIAPLATSPTELAATLPSVPATLPPEVVQAIQTAQDLPLSGLADQLVADVPPSLLQTPSSPYALNNAAPDLAEVAVEPRTAVGNLAGLLDVAPNPPAPIGPEPIWTNVPEPVAALDSPPPVLPPEMVQALPTDLVQALSPQMPPPLELPPLESGLLNSATESPVAKLPPEVVRAIDNLQGLFEPPVSAFQPVPAPTWPDKLPRNAVGNLEGLLNEQPLVLEDMTWAPRPESPPSLAPEIPPEPPVVTAKPTVPWQEEALQSLGDQLITPNVQPDLGQLEGLLSPQTAPPAPMPYLEDIPVNPPAPTWPELVPATTELPPEMVKAIQEVPNWYDQAALVPDLVSQGTSTVEAPPELPAEPQGNLQPIEPQPIDRLRIPEFEPNPQTGWLDLPTPLVENLPELPDLSASLPPVQPPVFRAADNYGDGMSGNQTSVYDNTIKLTGSPDLAKTASDTPGSALDNLKNFTGPLGQWVADNPGLAKLIFTGGGGLLAASGKPSAPGNGYRDSGYRPTISRGGWQAHVTPTRAPSVQPTAGLLSLPTQGQANDGAWRYLLGR